ncbi:MAG: hypothetical protein ACJ776_02500 [Chloroflexota bacterium]
MAQDTDEPETTERGPDDLARLVEALHPSKEEDERAERFAARLLEQPAVPESAPSSASTADPEHDRLVAALVEAKRRSWQRDVLMAAIGAILGIVGTLIVVALT